MRHTGTQRVRLCGCSNNNFSKQHADSSSDIKTQRALTTLLAALITFIHTKLIFYMHTMSCKQMQVYSMCTEGYTARLVYSQKMLLSNCYFKSQQFPFSLWSNLHISLILCFHPIDGGLSADRLSYCMRKV